MKSVNHRNIRMISEDSKIYDTAIGCELPLPRFIIDRQGKLFQKIKSIFESGRSRVVYSELLVTNLSEVEVTTES